MAIFGTLLASTPLEEVISKPLFYVPLGAWQLPFTNHMFVIMLASILMLILIPFSVHHSQVVPRGLYNLIETVCVFLREDVARPFLKDRTDRYIGFLWTMFFFILVMNLLGMTPLDKAFYIIFKTPHIGGAPTANLFVTGALATFAFFLFHLAGIFEKGFIKYFTTLAPPVPWPLAPFMFLMELISSFVRLFSLAIRLFANILAGHILIAVLLGFIIIFKNFMVASASILATTVMSLLEIFVAFLQAYIFTFLTAIFIGFAISEEH